MVRSLLHRAFSLLLALALGVAFVLTSAEAAEMAGKMVAQGATMSMPDDLNGCGGEDGMNPAVCIGVAPAILPVGLFVVPPRSATFVITAPLQSSGRSGSPDPYPPRSSLPL